MTIPATLKTAQFRRPNGKAITDCDQIPERKGNLVLAAHDEKPKRQSSADLLGVLAHLRNVASGCCIRTTILAGFNTGGGGFGFHRWNKPMGGPVKDRTNQPACAEPEIPSLSARYPQRKKAAATSAAA
jgi:hypothetical protein